MYVDWKCVVFMRLSYNLVCPFASCLWLDSKGSCASPAARPMGQGVVWQVRPRGTFALGSGRRVFLSTVELRGDGGVEVAGGEGTEEKRAGGLEVVRRLAGGGVGAREGR